ncbi:MAG: hypothetical protein ACI9WC_003938, partial [Arenicella sp.]
YGEQANIALWNLYQLANALYPLIEETKPLEVALENFQSNYQDQARAMMVAKLGLLDFKQQDQQLFNDLESLMIVEETDMTIFYRLLASAPGLSYADLQEAYYKPESHSSDFILAVNNWLEKYQHRLVQDDLPFEQRQASMNAVNPKYVFRNYLAQQAIDKADLGDYSMVQELLELFRNPYAEQTDMQHYASKRPDWARTKVGCSMLSCSS